VKDHIFHEAHLLDRYVDVGVPAEMRRFDSELGIAIARQWQDPSYNRAHTRTQKRFPAPYLEEEL
jgi:hypothetical protein